MRQKDQKEIVVLKLLKDMKTFYDNTHKLRYDGDYYNPYPEPVPGDYTLGYCILSDKIIGYQNLYSKSKTIKIGCYHEDDCYIPFSGINLFDLQNRFKENTVEKFISLLKNWEGYKDLSPFSWGKDEFYNLAVNSHKKWLKLPKEKKISELNQIFFWQKKLKNAEKKIKDLELKL